MSQEKEELQRLLEVLRTLMRMLAFSNREIERRLGLNNSSLTRLFNGQIEAKIETVLGIVRVIGLTYEEFFSFAYPNRLVNPKPSDAARRIHEMLADLRPSQISPPKDPPPPPPEKPRFELDRSELMEEFKKAVRAILEEQAEDPGGAKSRRAR